MKNRCQVCRNSTTAEPQQLQPETLQPTLQALQQAPLPAWQFQQLQPALQPFQLVQVPTAVDTGPDELAMHAEQAFGDLNDVLEDWYDSDGSEQVSEHSDDEDASDSDVVMDTEPIHELLMGGEGTEEEFGSLSKAFEDGEF